MDAGDVNLVFAGLHGGSGQGRSGAAASSSALHA
jgi:hypothetical protein